jgi:hypothetical protein
MPPHRTKTHRGKRGSSQPWDKEKRAKEKELRAQMTEEEVKYGNVTVVYLL